MYKQKQYICDNKLALTFLKKIRWRINYSLKNIIYITIQVCTKMTDVKLNCYCYIVKLEMI